ncbi:FxSxx-COOH system tetratricopeptide repeat protein, partial [Streptomyces sp. NPDC053048]|uniref:FxSxx-COOH system tetratricopeptide repeat protein n=1 Tax=Streptomyces sp. NPDC053048 TaxID=3365694 RepID=UPI0037D78D4B
MNGGRPDRELAVLLSTATRIEPELIRSVRLTVAPRLDVAAETDLWFGDLVERRGAGHIVLRRDLLPDLRSELAALLRAASGDAAVHRLPGLVDEVHRHGSPALHAEEQAVWHAVQGGPHSESQIERALLPALRALVDERRDGIARWFAHAWGRLPDPVRKAKTAWQLATVTKALNRAADSAVSIRPYTPDGLLLADVGLIAARLPRAQLYALRNGAHLVLGKDAAVTGAYTLSLPDTDPAVLEITTPTGPATVLVGRGESVTRKVGGGAVRLTVADGSVYVIPATHPVPAERAGEDGSVMAAEHILISYAGFHRPWAGWIAHCLKSHGLRITMERWDPRRETSLETAIGDLLLRTPGRILLVLSDWFFALGPRRADEWSEALRGIVAANAQRFAAVNLTNRTLLPVTAVLEPVDLWGVGAQEAERRLLGRLGLPTARARRPLPAGPRYPNDSPAVWGEVPRRNVRFTGRDDLLDRIQEYLTDAEQGTAAVALLGMPGVGKTQMAAEYAHRFSSDYDVVWWVNSDTRGTLREHLSELAVELGLVSGSESGEHIRAVREALRRGEPHARWLLVFDGWDDTEDAGEILPNGPGHVLITSRNRTWSGEGVATIEVPNFRRSESIGYLLRRAPRITAEQADEVASELNDMPLVLVQAAAWLGESDMGVSEYLRMMRDGAATDPGDFDGVVRSSLTSWTILINRLRESQPHAVEILTLCASFAPGRIPIGLVRHLRPDELPEGLGWLASDLPTWTRALDTLVNFSVLSRDHPGGYFHGDPGPEQESVHMHRLVHGIVARLTSPDVRVLFQRVACRTLVTADPGNPQDSSSWPRYAELLPHLEPAGALSADEPDAQRLVLNCLSYTLACGAYGVGAGLAEQARAEWAQLLRPDDRRMLDLTLAQCGILRSLGRFREAYELDRATIEGLRGSAGPDTLSMVHAGNSLAADQRYLGQYTEALQMQREVLETSLELLGPDDYLTLLAQHNLGVGLRLVGR